MSSHSLTAGGYLLTAVAVRFLYTLVLAQSTASIENQFTDQNVLLFLQLRSQRSGGQ